MSPRIKTIRKVLNPPVIKGFKPYGPDLENMDVVPVNLLYEEYEALRLSDYDMLNHHQSSVLMEVSRPTFTRIYASALQKIAKAFVEGRQIAISGGKVYFDSDWYNCKGCNCNFNNPERDEEILKCPLCGDKRIKSLDPIQVNDPERPSDTDDVCICTHCRSMQPHKAGVPCNQLVCPECGSRMKRRGAQRSKNEKN